MKAAPKLVTYDEFRTNPEFIHRLTLIIDSAFFFSDLKNRILEVCIIYIVMSTNSARSPSHTEIRRSLERRKPSFLESEKKVDALDLETRLALGGFDPADTEKPIPYSRSRLRALRSFSDPAYRGSITLRHMGRASKRFKIRTPRRNENLEWLIDCVGVIAKKSNKPSLMRTKNNRRYFPFIFAVIEGMNEFLDPGARVGDRDINLAIRNVVLTRARSRSSS